MAMRGVCTWFVVLAALMSGCALGPLGSYRAVSPAEASVDSESLSRLATSGVERLAPQPLTAAEFDSVWEQLAAESKDLADQAAGEEIVVRHVYGEEPTVSWDEMSDLGKGIAVIGLVLGLVVIAWAFSGTTY